MRKPGIMIYFDIAETVRSLRPSDAGRLLLAMLDYGQYGSDPKLTGTLRAIWPLVKPKLDKDQDMYENVVVQRKYAGFCKSRTSRNLPKIPFDTWLAMTDGQRKRAISEDIDPIFSEVSDIERDPTTTTTTAATTAATPAEKTNTTASTAAAAETPPWDDTASQEAEAAATAADRKLKVMGGRLGKGVVMLSEEQTGDLLDKMDLAVFDYYVSKLSDFILKHDAKVKNHYATILKWWQEDSQCP